MFIYLFDETDPDKRNTARELIRVGLETRRGVISFQVVQETLNVLTRKLATPVTTADARDFLDRVLMPLCRVMPVSHMYHRAVDIQERFRFGFYDSLIIAAALDAECTRLYSEDMQHGQRIEELIIENPFSSGPRR